MKLIKEFNRNGNRGTISQIYNDETYTATTATQTKNFKSLKGAEKFMAKYEYIEVK